jgi:DNA-directed RNA polymerase beta subunit
VFDGATENEVHELLAEANDYVAQRGADTAAVQQAGATREVFAHMPRGGKITVYDGRSGEPFDQRVTVGLTCTCSSSITWWMTRSTPGRRVRTA